MFLVLLYLFSSNMASMMATVDSYVNDNSAKETKLDRVKTFLSIVTQRLISNIKLGMISLTDYCSISDMLGHYLRTLDMEFSVPVVEFQASLIENHKRIFGFSRNLRVPADLCDEQAGRTSENAGQREVDFCRCTTLFYCPHREATQSWIIY